MSSSPSTMFEETSNEYAVTSGEEFSDVPGEEEEESEMSEEGSDEEPEPEPEGLTFYHMDLYESRDRLEIFPEDQFIKVERDENEAEVSESDAAGDTWASSAEYKLQKEVEELARLYGIDEGMAREGDLLEFCAPVIETVASKQPAEQKNVLEKEDAEDHMEEQDTEESEFAEQSHQEVNEETSNQEPSNTESYTEEPCDEEPHRKEPGGEEPGSKGPRSVESGREDPHSEELQSEEKQNEECGNEELQSEEPPNEEPQSEETSRGQPQSEEPCSEELQSEKFHIGDTQSGEHPNEESQSKELNKVEPLSEEPCSGELHIEEPHTAETQVKELHIEQHGIEEPPTEEPHTEEPHAEERLTEEPQTEEPHAEEPHAEEPHAEEPHAEEPHAEEPHTEEPHAEEPLTEEPHMEETHAEEPHMEEPDAEEPYVEEPHAEEPHTEEPHAEEPHMEEAHTEEPPTEEPHAEQPHMEEPHVEEPLTEESHSEEPCMEVQDNMHVCKDDAVNEDMKEEPFSYTPEQKEDQRAGASQTLEHDEELQPREEEEPKTQDEEIPDIFCVTCKTPIRAFEKLFGSHKDHEVAKLPSAVEDIKDEIHKNMCSLEEQIAQMENFAGHLEEIFITVEENFGRQEQSFDLHFTEIMQTLTQRYEEKTQALEEEKKQKLEALYGQLVDCGKTLDTSKDLMETIQELFKSKDKVAFVKTAVDTLDRLEEFLKSDVDYQVLTYPDYENKTIDFSEVQQLLDSINTLPAPSAPVINPQTPNSATGTSVKVCWSLFSDDTVERYHLYYKPVSDGAPNEEQAECVINVKETYCTVENLVPNTQYEFWVTALNTTGIGPASERAVYMTAPSPPIIKYKQCRNCENAALICWESGENVNPVDSYTVEISKAADEERGQCIAESIVGIPSCESLVPLRPGEIYNIYVRAANVGGPSERSTSVTVHTTGTFFHLSDSTAHPLLSILDDGLTILCQVEEGLGDLPYHYNSFTRCIAVMGNLIPVKGKHYWEVDVEESTEYRIGVAFEDTNRNGYIGANNTSWCMRHVITPSRHKYEFLHCGTTPDVRITIPPQIIGILLDYDNWKLSFFNMEPFQHLHTFSCHFQHLVHPCFALEKPGILRIRNGIATPQCVSAY